MAEGTETKLRVLIVEDDQFISEMISSALSNSACQPYHTGDGNAAVRMTEQVRPHVIILDLMLPGMSGEEILTTLKQNAELKSIPVLIYSNVSDLDDKEKLLGLGASDFMVKVETDLHTLIDRVKELGK